MRKIIFTALVAVFAIGFSPAIMAEKAKPQPKQKVEKKVTKAQKKVPPPKQLKEKKRAPKKQILKKKTAPPSPKETVSILRAARAETPLQRAMEVPETTSRCPKEPCRGSYVRTREGVYYIVGPDLGASGIFVGYARRLVEHEDAEVIPPHAREAYNAARLMAIRQHTPPLPHVPVKAAAKKG